MDYSSRIHCRQCELSLSTVRVGRQLSEFSWYNAEHHLIILINIVWQEGYINMEFVLLLTFVQVRVWVEQAHICS